MVWFSCAQVKVQDLKKSFNGVEKKLMSVEKPMSADTDDPGLFDL